MWRHRGFWVPSVALMCLWAAGCSFDGAGITPPGNSNDNNTQNNTNNNQNGNCGDGQLGSGEACDDGNVDSGDGCGGDCLIEQGWVCSGQTSVCTPVCGDGIVIPGPEACDDGDLSPNDGCSPDCTVESGYQCAGEPSVCTATCGDGLVAQGVEGCDDGNVVSGDGCGSDCVTETGWVCFGEPSTCNETCGNGATDMGEFCDDGNNTSCDGCAADCSRADDQCGDGFTECGEVCDDANNIGCDGCNADCSRVDNDCGDNITECNEACDDGNNDDCDGCAGNCLRMDNDCGDNIQECGEGCDDGNNDDCDGCAGNCSRPDDVCGDGIAECSEACEGTDFRGATCASETGGSQTGGNLTCTGGCAITTGGCITAMCADHAACPVGQQCGPTGCEAVGNTCDDSPFVLAATGQYTHTLEHLTNDYNGGANGLGCPDFHVDDSDGQDRVYRIDLNAGDYFSVWVHAQGWSPTLYLSTACPITTCLRGRNDAFANQDHASERLDHVASTSQTLFLVVDGQGSDGDYTLEFTRGAQADWTPLGGTGQVIFSEVMANPNGTDATDEEWCEWFEIYNPNGSQARNLRDATFTSPAGNFTINRHLLIGPHEWMLIAMNAEYGYNCGVGPVSWSYYSSPFNLWMNNPCLLEIRNTGNALVDDIDYDTGWPFQDARSMYLCTNRLNDSDNDSSGNWLMTPNTNPYSYTGNGYTNYGTPALANPGPCP